MSRVLSNRKVNPRARTAEDFEVAKRPVDSRAAYDGESLKSTTSGQLHSSGEMQVPTTVGYAVLAYAILASFLAIYLQVNSGTQSVDQKNQQYIQELQNKIAALETDKAEFENTIKALRNEKEKVAADNKTQVNTIRGLESDRKEVCKLLSSARASIANAKENCGTAGGKVCSTLSLVSRTDIPKYCGASGATSD